jgi:hypothetical protein
VIPYERHKVPLKLAIGSTPLVEIDFPTFIPSLAPAPAKPRIHAEVGRYRLRLAQTAEDRDAACRLRFKVFNIELGEGLESSYQTGLDTDRFDLCCEHLLVEDKLEDNPATRIVGTYRMQSGATAARNLGYYSEQEFSFAPYEPLRPGRHSGARPRLHRPRTPHSRGADLVMEGDRAVCYQHGAALLDRLLIVELERPGGGLADVQPA